MEVVCVRVRMGLGLRCGWGMSIIRLDHIRTSWVERVGGDA